MLPAGLSLSPLFFISFLFVYKKETEVKEEQ